MARPPLPIGTFGKIDFLTVRRGHVRARARYRDHDGVVRSVTRFGPTKPRAESLLKQTLRDRVAPGAADSDARIGDLADQWLAEIGRRDLAPATKEVYADLVERIVRPGLGHCRVREMTVPTVDRFIVATVSSSGPAAAKTTRTVLSGMPGLAVRHGALGTNPMRDVGRVSRARKQVRALTPGEATQLRAAVRADPRSAALDLPDLVDFMLGTGTRIGEACALTWHAVDLDAGVLEIRATVVRTKEHGLIVQDRPKSDAGWRVIALPMWIVDLLRRRGHTSGQRGGDVVFPTALGNVRDRSNTTGDLRRAFDRAGFYWVSSHTLRKTVATRLDDAGLSARQIADHLGHARPSITQDVYLGRKAVSSQAASALDLAP